MIYVNLSSAQFERLISIVATHCDSVDQQIKDCLQASGAMKHISVNLDSLNEQMKARDEDKAIFNVLLNTKY